ncbi:MAG TPA: Flp pilus assembly protein CpaB [Nitrospiria bacterium]|nr:Flp pilus assembly protein CpaB [Nitrospiria bacterium]
MRSRGPYIALATAIALGLLTTFLAYRWMQGQALAKPAPQAETLLVASVVVAALELPPGSVIQKESLKMMSWPKNSMPEAVITDPGFLLGRVIIAPMLPGEPFTESKLAAKGVEGGLTAIIEPGKRAMSVRVDEIIGVAGFVAPGTFVDVLVVLESKNKGVDATIKTLLQNIKVLASGQKIMQEKDKPSLVNVMTLEVTVDEAQKLALAASRGRLQLALRNQTDNKEIKTPHIHTHQLLGGPPKMVKKGNTTVPERVTVEVIRGDERSNHRVSNLK